MSRSIRDGFLLRHVSRFVPGGLIQLRERIAESISQVCRSPTLLLEYRVLDDRRPDGAVLLISSLERTVFVFSEWAAFLAAGLLEER